MPTLRWNRAVVWGGVEGTEEVEGSMASSEFVGPENKTEKKNLSSAPPVLKK